MCDSLFFVDIYRIMFHSLKILNLHPCNNHNGIKTNYKCIKDKKISTIHSRITTRGMLLSSCEMQ